MTIEDIEDNREMNIMYEIVGKTVNEAETVLKESNEILRVVEKDGISYITTVEYCPERINVAIQNNIVTRVISRG